MNKLVLIHPSAQVSNEASVGEGTKIWINVQVRERAIIGKNCIVSKDVYIDHAVKIGDGCKIQNGVSIYHGVEIGDDVFVGPHVSFTNDKVPRAFNTEWQISPTQVAKGASIGANATIVCGVTIGEYAMVAAGSVVTKNVPPFTLVMGNPAHAVATIDKAGNRLDSSLNEAKKDHAK
jgi:acetyltransferase-like isoleucine patch superfamily enzyme